MKTVIIDCEEIKSREELHDFLSLAFELPEYYGRNLDALYDCLSELPDPIEVRLLSRESLMDSLGRYAGGFFEVMKRIDGEKPNITVLSL